MWLVAVSVVRPGEPESHSCKTRIRWCCGKKTASEKSNLRSKHACYHSRHSVQCKSVRKHTGQRTLGGVKLHTWKLTFVCVHKGPGSRLCYTLIEAYVTLALVCVLRTLMFGTVKTVQRRTGEMVQKPVQCVCEWKPKEHFGCVCLSLVSTFACCDSRNTTSECGLQCDP